MYNVENSLIPSGTFNTGQDASTVKSGIWKGRDWLIF